MIELAEDNPMAWYIRAVAQFGLQHYDEALADMNKCIELGGEVDEKFIESVRKAADRLLPYGLEQVQPDE